MARSCSPPDAVRGVSQFRRKAAEVERLQQAAYSELVDSMAGLTDEGRRRYLHAVGEKAMTISRKIHKLSRKGKREVEHYVITMKRSTHTHHPIS